MDEWVLGVGWGEWMSGFWEWDGGVDEWVLGVGWGRVDEWVLGVGWGSG